MKSGGWLAGIRRRRRRNLGGESGGSPLSAGGFQLRPQSKNPPAESGEPPDSPPRFLRLLRRIPASHPPDFIGRYQSETAHHASRAARRRPRMVRSPPYRRARLAESGPHSRKERVTRVNDKRRCQIPHPATISSISPAKSPSSPAPAAVSASTSPALSQKRAATSSSPAATSTHSPHSNAK